MVSEDLSKLDASFDLAIDFFFDEVVDFIVSKFSILLFYLTCFLFNDCHLGEQEVRPRFSSFGLGILFDNRPSSVRLHFYF